MKILIHSFPLQFRIYSPSDKFKKIIVEEEEDKDEEREGGGERERE